MVNNDRFDSVFKFSSHIERSKISWDIKVLQYMVDKVSHPNYCTADPGLECHTCCKNVLIWTCDAFYIIIFFSYLLVWDKNNIKS